MPNSNATAVIDAAIVYGASRWMRGIHTNPSNEWEQQYKARDDKLLFQEFLHDLVLYDRIVMDSSSASRSVPNELLELFAKVNAHANTELLSRTQLAPYKWSQISDIAEATCRLISGVIEDAESRRRVLSCRIPWAYKSSVHNDYEMVAGIISDMGMDLDLVPFALFSFRGLCYSGFANSTADITETPMVYVASPGRIAALRHVMDAQDLKRIEFARRSYRDLVGLLQLPENGYNFSQFNSLDPNQVSQLALAVSSKTPRDALKMALSLRSSSEARIMRQRWADRIWATTKSSAVGSNEPIEMKMDNISAGRDVYQIYYASPA
jgi:hypothetical protein